MEWKHLHLTQEEFSGDTTCWQNADNHLLGVIGCATGGRTLPHREAREIPPEVYFPVF